MLDFLVRFLLLQGQAEHQEAWLEFELEQRQACSLMPTPCTSPSLVLLAWETRVPTRVR